MFQTRAPALGALSLLALACAGAPPSSLVDAQKTYQRAAQGPAAQLAPAQLHAAEVYLNLAKQTYDDEGASANARDRAYVAMRKSELAEVQANITRANLDMVEIAKQAEAQQQNVAQATRSELDQTRAQLASERQVIASQGSQLQAEIERRQRAEAAQKQALEALGNVKQDDRGTVITLSGSVIFPSGGSDLLPTARNKLAEVATALSQDGSTSKVVVEGHTDSTGSPEKNEALSRRRAESVRNELVARGVSTGRISVQGYGASRPLADNDTPAGRANNRRVEIVVQPAS